MEGGNEHGNPRLVRWSAAHHCSKTPACRVDAITGNYDAFRDEGLSPDVAIAETSDCYPEAGLEAIKAILNYRAAHQFQAQP
jgi:hypothetical protein